MNIEKIAVDTISLTVSRSDFLVPDFNSGDRGPSWDGDIEVYKTAGANHTKNDLDIKIPIQVKGKISENLKKKTIHYPVQISDLRNYLQVGGTVYFVVYINSSGDKTQIYYASLLPFELKKILEKYGSQATRQIQLTALPKKKDEMTDIFLCFARDMKRQKAAISCASVTIEDLAKDGILNEISFGYTTVSRKHEMPFEHLFDHGAYIYAKLPYGIELPIDHFEKITCAKTKRSVPVTVDGKIFYPDFEVVYKKNIAELHLGKSIILTFNRKEAKSRFDFSLSGTLSERIKDAEFIVEAMTAQKFNVGDAVYPLDNPESETSSFDLPKLKNYLEWLKSVKKMLDVLRVKDDLDFSKLTKLDKQNIETLKSAVLDKEAVPLKNNGEIFGVYTIANLKILVCTSKHKEQDNLFNIYGFNDAPVEMRVSGENGEEYPLSYYVILTKDSLLKCCNIDYEAMLQHIKKVPFSDKYCNRLNQLLLELLRAYDESNPPRKDILHAGLKLSEWLKDNDPYFEKEILTLNYYQTVKRIRPLEQTEIQDILSITENSSAREEFYVGAYILLGNFVAAKIHFDVLPSEMQEIFRTYPIFHLWKQESQEK